MGLINIIKAQFLYKLIWRAHRLFTGGALVIIKPTMRCNLSCPYCSNVIATGCRQDYGAECTPQQWLDFLGRWPGKIQVVSISGGEPQMYPRINGFVAELLERGYWVRMMTNLTLRNIGIPPSPRFCVVPTYHSQVPFDFWLKNLAWYRRRYHVVLAKKFNAEKIQGSQNFDIVDEQYHDLLNNKIHRFRQNVHNKFVIMPDLRVWISCLEANKNRTLTGAEDAN